MDDKYLVITDYQSNDPKYLKRGRRLRHLFLKKSFYFSKGPEKSVIMKKSNARLMLKKLLEQDIYAAIIHAGNKKNFYKRR